MHKLLEEYIDEVKIGLRRLPAHERVQEVEEVKAHLESLADANEEMGDTEEQAAKNALRQFGNAKEVSEGLKESYKRKALKAFRFRDTLAASSGAGVLSAILSGMFMMWLLPYLYTIAPTVGYAIAAPPQGNWMAYQFVFYTKTLLYGVLMALLTHWMAPKRAVEGMLVAVLLMTVFGFLMSLNAYVTTPSMLVSMPHPLERDEVSIYATALLMGLVFQWRRNHVARKKATIA